MSPKAKTGVPIYDPTVEPEIDPARPAPREGALSGKRVGLLWNSKAGGDKLMRFVLEALRAGGADLSLAAEIKKEYDTRPASKAAYDEMAEKCDLIITAVGD
ncbi:MAG: hypothetical protein V3V62_06725 [bacterium]